jgi:glycogen debranching enzyme
MSFENKLTPQLRGLLTQGTKVRFMWHGNKTMVYTGRIEVAHGVLYFCAEHNYKGENLTNVGKSMQYYNTLDSFFSFDMFEIV